jgi:hypothetical protein
MIINFVLGLRDGDCTDENKTSSWVTWNGSEKFDIEFRTYDSCGPRPSEDIPQASEDNLGDLGGKTTQVGNAHSRWDI